LLALELAAANPSPGSCKTILGRLSDPNATVRSVAGNLIGQCRDHDNAPDLLHALEQQKEPSIRSALVGQLGVAGGKEQVPVLRQLRGKPDVSAAASLALAQLGDADERQKLIDRLQDPDPQVRTNALRDCMTVRDPELAAWFGPALEDFRDAVPITGPHEGPMVYARVCDFAVLVMAQLGYRFSFPVGFLERRPLEQIREARQAVDALIRERGQE
jgi:HEAT repeat protein